MGMRKGLEIRDVVSEMTQRKLEQQEVAQEQWG